MFVGANNIPGDRPGPDKSAGDGRAVCVRQTSNFAFILYPTVVVRNIEITPEIQNK